MYKLNDKKVKEFNDRYKNFLCSPFEQHRMLELMESYYTMFDLSQCTVTESIALESVKQAMVAITSSLDQRGKHRITPKKVRSYMDRFANKYIMVQPLTFVLEYMDNSVYGSHNDNCPVIESNYMSHIDSGLDSVKLEQVQQTDFSDLLFTMVKEGFIPDTLLDTYLNKIQTANLATLSRLKTSLEGICESTDGSITTEPSTTGDFVCFPNSHRIDAMYKHLQQGFNVGAYVLESLVEDTLYECTSIIESSELYCGMFRDFATIWEHRQDKKHLTAAMLTESVTDLSLPCYETTEALKFCYILCEALQRSRKELPISSTQRSISEILQERPEKVSSITENLASYQELLAKTTNSKYKLSVITEQSDFPLSGSPDWVTEKHEVGDIRSSAEYVESLTESFQILKNGTIRIKISPKTTFMDEYVTNHRLLMENYRLKDYNAMKYNLVYDLILIDSIEKNVLHNEKVSKSSELYLDAEKAKMQANTDVSRYLPIVKQNIPDFNLNQFYQEVDAERNTIEIDTVSTILGTKQILKYILL